MTNVVYVDFTPKPPVMLVEDCWDTYEDEHQALFDASYIEDIELTPARPSLTLV